MWLAVLGAGIIVRVAVTSLRAGQPYRAHLLRDGLPLMLMGFGLLVSPLSLGASGVFMSLAFLTGLAGLLAWFCTKFRRRNQTSPDQPLIPPTGTRPDS